MRSATSVSSAAREGFHPKFGISGRWLDKACELLPMYAATGEEYAAGHSSELQVVQILADVVESQRRSFSE